MPVNGSLPVIDLSSSAAIFRLSELLEQITTLLPSFKNNSAAAFPIPLLEAVIKTTLSFNSKFI